MIRFLFALVLLTNSAFGQDLFGTDFDGIFDAHVDEVVRTEKDNGQWEERLTLPGPVLLTRGVDSSGNVFHYGLDQSGNGAVGCFLIIAIDVRATADHCPGTVSPEQASALDKFLEAATQFYARNNIPSRAVSAVRDGIQESISYRTQQMEPAICDGESIKHIQGFASALAAPDSLENIDAALGPPRLPVTNPCL
ncbi:MAG: hypothetical protein OXC60_12830 [Litoreibacter sp.]|nr:hypothetical protein [Litoreibacter sp.]MCY4335539.1 hypothetical protein [Litoreibacter sp.]